MQPTASSAALPGFHRGVAKTRSSPSSTNTETSSHGAQRGRVSHVWSYRFSSSCAWTSLPGIALAERRLRVVDQRKPGHAHQDQLALQARCVDLAVEHVDGGDVATRIALRIVEANLPVRLGRQRERADGDGVDVRPSGVQANVRHAERDAQHLRRQRRHETIGDADDERRAPDDVVRGPGRNGAMSGRGPIELVDVRQRSGEARHVRRDAARRRRVRRPIDDQDRRRQRLDPGRLGRACQSRAPRVRRRWRARARCRSTAARPGGSPGRGRPAVPTAASAPATAGPASGIRMSMPIANGSMTARCPGSVRRGASSATATDPCRARLRSSISTTMTGVDATSRGFITWYASNHADWSRTVQGGAHQTSAVSPASSAKPMSAIRP